MTELETSLKDQLGTQTAILIKTQTDLSRLAMEVAAAERDRIVLEHRRIAAGEKLAAMEVLNFIRDLGGSDIDKAILKEISAAEITHLAARSLKGAFPTT